jgi:hypothetical protein
LWTREVDEDEASCACDDEAGCLEEEEEDF